MSNNNFAIIGGGGTGTMVLIYLALQVKSQQLSLAGQNFHLFDPDGFGNGGIAYGRCGNKHILNSIRDEMSPWDKYEFHKWCVDQGKVNNIYEFNRRADYRVFLKEKYDYAIDILKTAGAVVTEHKCKADIRHSSDQRFFNITDDNKNLLLSDLSSDNIVVTTGYGAPNDSFAHLEESKNYIHNLYDRYALETTLSKLNNPNIAFIGSGAALNDFSFEYPELDNQINLTSFSRSGKPLTVRDTTIEANEVSYMPRFIYKKFNTVTELETTIMQELKTERPCNSARRRGLDITSNLSIILDNQTIDIARGFRLSPTATELRHAATPVPPESYIELSKFSVDYIAAQLNGNIAILDQNDFAIKYNNQAYKFDVIINGTGHKRLSPLAESMLNSELAEYNEHQGTLRTHNDGIRLVGSNIYCAGSAVHCGTDGIESFAPKTAKIAQEFIKTIEDTRNNLALGITTSNIPKSVYA